MSFTALTDKGAGANGTHSDVTLYNNVVGTSYQFRARNGTLGTDQNGIIIFAPPGQCTTVSPPSTTGFALDGNEFRLSTSDSQCNGPDKVEFVLSIDTSGTPADNVNVTIIDGDTGLSPMLIDDSQMFLLGGLSGSHIFHFNRTLSPGPWVALALHDHAVATRDFFAAEAFDVPIGSCLDSIQDGHDAAMTDEHFDQDLLHPGGGGGGGGLLSLANFPGTALDDSTGMVFFFILMLWALWQGLFFLGGSSLLGLLFTWLASLDVGGDWDGGVGFAAGFALVTLAAWMEAMIRGWRLRGGKTGS